MKGTTVNPGFFFIKNPLFKGFFSIFGVVPSPYAEEVKKIYERTAQEAQSLDLLQINYDLVHATYEFPKVDGPYIPHGTGESSERYYEPIFFGTKGNSGKRGYNKGKR